MPATLFPVDGNAAALLLGIGRRKTDEDRLLTKAFLIGQQAGALERMRMQFLQEQNQALQSNMQMMSLLMSLLQKNQQGVQPPPVPGVTPAGGMSGLPVPPGDASKMAGIVPQSPLPPDAGLGGAPQPPVPPTGLPF